MCSSDLKCVFPVGIGELTAEGLDDHPAGILAGLGVEVGGVDQAGGVDPAYARGTDIVRVHTDCLPASGAHWPVEREVISGVMSSHSPGTHSENGLRGRDQCSRTVCPGRICGTLSMSSSVTTPITGYMPVTG